MRVLLGDTHPAYRRGLRALLTSFPGVEVVADIDDGRLVVDAAQRLDPDVIVLGLHLAGIGGLELTRRLSHEGAGFAVVVVSLDDDEALELLAREAGAVRLVAMGGPPADLLAALEDAAGISRANRDIRLMTPGTGTPENAADDPGG